MEKGYYLEKMGLKHKRYNVAIHNKNGKGLLRHYIKKQQKMKVCRNPQ